MGIFIAMGKMTLIVCGLLVMCNAALAQHGIVAGKCADSKINSYKYAAKSTVAAPEEEDYDVLEVEMDLALNNTSVDITGDVSTTARVLKDNFGLYVFELNEKLQITSMTINGLLAQYSRSGDIVKVLMPKILHRDSVFTARAIYSGAPDAGSVFFFQSGLNNAPAAPWGNMVTYTLSEPYASKDWWPCKQSLQDKINKATISVTVPDSLMVGSNGLLVDVDVTGATRRYTWKTEYPTAYYLLSVAVADYRNYQFTKEMPDGKKVRVQNYIYDSDSVYEQYKSNIDTTGDMLYYFSELFGTYPFYEEKYGHCMAPVFGGMEHQTMTTLHDFDAPLVAHELVHQWFGDNVTCATWRDIWLNEGFATYGEYLYAEKFWTEETALAYMSAIHGIVTDDTAQGGRIYMPAGDTVNPYRIFDNRLSYKKPAAVLHTLRYLVNNDEVFFNIFKEYQLRFASANADTRQFMELAEELSGLSLQLFFDQWVYGEGYPVYHVRWNQLGNELVLLLEQETTVPAAVPFFDVPLELQINTVNGDTTIKVSPLDNNEMYRMTITGEVDGIDVDPNEQVLNRATVYRDLRIGVGMPAGDDVVVYPNPTNNAWAIANVKAGTEMILTDINGKTLWQTITNTNYGVSIPAANLSRGVYMLHLKYGEKKLTSKKLLKL